MGEFATTPVSVMAPNLVGNETAQQIPGESLPLPGALPQAEAIATVGEINYRAEGSRLLAEMGATGLASLAVYAGGECKGRLEDALGRHPKLVGRMVKEFVELQAAEPEGASLEDIISGHDASLGDMLLKGEDGKFVQADSEEEAKKKLENTNG